MEVAKWNVQWKVSKYEGDINACKTEAERQAFLKKPCQVVKGKGNCLLNTGINELWELVAGASANHFDNTHATIGVGNSTTAAAAAQTDLQGASKTYKGMEATYPLHTTQAITFKSVFGNAEANYAWNEWVVKQSTSSICLNRKVESMGTKASGSWAIEVAISLA